jgi:hypothetical protein
MLKKAFSASALALLAVGCSSTGQDINDHWNARSYPPRAARFLLGYDASRDGNYMDFQWERKQDINLTLRRYFLHQNPDNPNHPDWPGRFAPRPRHSPFPNPIPYVHFEGVLLGLGALGAGGSWVALPIDSLIATLDDDHGPDEFMLGVQELFSPVGVVTTSFLDTYIGPALDGTVTTVTSVGD